ncbi:TIGR01777 family oxidoreductase [Flavobacterium sp. NRK F10]|uniref:TIGR01777 family oxidoreductase n=1 Tax=Flavobacterium sp. NRK F10 TaxID=2954931 RepID=UPI00209076EC|nr:TIGR01777 family oxidoreductase [Flavobacterium sp. NRK F10]MCO6175579.1 TIGR01777 family oxidoreductase [Flavobacterium sp. NRK F10]
MKVLITGATGLIGSELVKLLLQRGVKVNYLTSSKSKLIKEENYQGFYWNPDKGEIDLDAFEEVECLINLAGATVSKKWTPAYKQEIIESRVLSTRLLYQSLLKDSFEVKQIISASAIGVYPSSETTIYTEESNQIDNSFLGCVVAKWEDEVKNFAKLGIRVSFVRIGLVLAPDGGALTEMLKPIKLGLGATFGSGKQYQSWIHIKDLARIFSFIMDNELEGIYNGVSPYPVTNEVLVKSIAQTLDKPLFLPGIPKMAMKLLLGEMHELLYSSQHVSARKILDEGFQFKYSNLDKALQDILQ